MRALDLTGQSFGWWTIISLTPPRGERRAWHCVCRCGVERDIPQCNLTGNKSLSCGCRRIDLNQQPGYGLRKYAGEAIYSREYAAWCAMKGRCSATQGYFFNHYVQRGITVCERWLHSFANFATDMGQSPGPGYSLGRIDNDRGYAPDNCRWETRTQQNRNKRNVPLLTWHGQTHTVPEWAEIVGITYSTLSQRLNRGWSWDDALTRPQRGVGGAVRYNMQHTG